MSNNQVQDKMLVVYQHQLVFRQYILLAGKDKWINRNTRSRFKSYDKIIDFRVENLWFKFFGRSSNEIEEFGLNDALRNNS